MRSQLIRQGKGVVYHYTSLEVLLKMIDNIKYGYFKFWASDIFSMNDPTEYKHGIEKTWSYFLKIEDEYYQQIKENTNETIELHQYIGNNYKLSNIWKKIGYKSQTEWISNYIDEMHKEFRTPFVISFSCQKDFLPMWTTYGDYGRGVALGFEVESYYIRKKLTDGTVLFDFTKVESNEPSSLLVSYNSFTKHHPLRYYIMYRIREYLNNLPRCEEKDIIKLQFHFINDILNVISTFIKNKAYSYEEESRLICVRDRIGDVKFRIDRNRNITPYIVEGILIDKLKEIIIGPCCDFNKVKMILETRFKQLGITIEDNKIIKSKIPYR